MPTRASRLLLLTLLPGCWLLAAPPAAAQTPSPSAAAADSLADIAQQDTLFAVPRLFRAERHAALGPLLLAGLVGGGSAWALATNTPSTTYQRISTGGLGLLAVGAVYEVAGQLVRLRRFRPARERRVLDALESGQPLPRWVRRRFKPAYFPLRPAAL